MKKKPKIGRPKKPARDRYLNPVRQVGRWDEDSWDLVRRAAEAEGKDVAAWARGILLPAAKAIVERS